MILSMTGFGRGTAVLNGREITVELRSVNSRYFEYSSRIPRTCSSLDSRLKKQLNQRISRGKVELSRPERGRSGYRGRRQHGACPQLSAGHAGPVRAAGGQK